MIEELSKENTQLKEENTKLTSTIEGLNSELQMKGKYSQSSYPLLLPLKYFIPLLNLLYLQRNLLKEQISKWQK